MLSVKDLVKVYKTKGGAEVRALDGVTLDFPDKGMVFLLGKSGSGKSTLLNVAGGLDRPDKGEIIVKGKSSKDFSASDFDSYRNTFIGFVFQEYNILNEFNVEQNISLALQLQNKKNDRAAVNALLEKVDLKGMGKRKPNTLSGGQKQRVAIARALIKEPEIIMADEPTGALDSNTGKQVFETLKKLSAEKLVIVVSHDREFAEQYGDRIIELKDGKVISDTSKELAPPSAISANVSVIGDDTIRIKDWNSLTDTDLARINTALKGKSREVIISADAADVAAFKRIGKISDDGSKEHFVATDTSKVEHTEYDGKKTKFIKSTMPLSRAVKMGASGLKTKPIRLFFTILLSVVSFTLFGVLSAMMLYDPIFSISDALQQSTYTSVTLQKYAIGTRTSIYYDGNNVPHRDEYEEERMTMFGKKELEELNNNSYGLDFAGVYTFADEYGGYSFFRISNTNASQQSEFNTEYYFTVDGFTGFTDCGADYMERNDFTLVAGDYPDEDNEVAVTMYFFDYFTKYGLTDGNGRRVTLETPLDLVGKQLFIGNDWGNLVKVPLTVSGVYDTNLPEKYESLKDLDRESLESYDEEIQNLGNEFSDVLRGGYHTLGYVTPNFVTKYKRFFDTSGELPSGNIENTTIEREESSGSAYGSVSYLSPVLADFSLATNYAFDMDENRLTDRELVFADNEVYISLDSLLNDAQILNTTYVSHRTYESATGDRYEEDGDMLDGWLYYDGIYVDPQTYEVSFEFVDGYMEATTNQPLYINRFGDIVKDPHDNWSNDVREFYYNGNGEATIEPPERYVLNYNSPSYYVDPKDENNISIDYVEGWETRAGYVFNDNTVLETITGSDYYVTYDSIWVYEPNGQVSIDDPGFDCTPIDCYYVFADGSMSAVPGDGFYYYDYFYEAVDGGYTIDRDKAVNDSIIYRSFMESNDGEYLPVDYDTDFGFCLNDETGEVRAEYSEGFRRVKGYLYNETTGEINYAQKYSCGYFINQMTGETKCDPTHDQFVVDILEGNYSSIYPDFGAAVSRFESLIYYGTTGFTEADMKLILQRLDEDWANYIGDDRETPESLYIKNSIGKGEQLTVIGYFYYGSSNDGYSFYSYILNDTLADKYNIPTHYSGDIGYSDSFETDYVEPEDACYNLIVTNTDNSYAACTFMLEDKENGLVRYKMNNSVYQQADNMSSMFETLTIVFLIIGLVMAVFSALMLFNFISTSISSKRKEIGILRAVGARGMDVFKIFFSEAVIIAIICFVLSSVCGGLACMIMNGVFSSSFISMSILNYGVINVALILGIAIVVSFLATILPVFFAARKSPVESIRSL